MGRRQQLPPFLLPSSRDYMDTEKVELYANGDRIPQRERERTFYSESARSLAFFLSFFHYQALPDKTHQAQHGGQARQQGINNGEEEGREREREIRIPRRVPEIIQRSNSQRGNGKRERERERKPTEIKGAFLKPDMMLLSPSILTMTHHLLP